jgi:hypothetical protein
MWRHARLRELWLKLEGMYSLLSPRKQWDIHAYYQPSKNLTDQALFTHREIITKENPSLPSRASKAFVELVRKVEAVALASKEARQKQAPQAVHHTRPRPRVVGVEVTGVVVQPEPDWDKFAWATLQHVKTMRENKEKKRGSK